MWNRRSCGAPCSGIPSAVSYATGRERLFSDEARSLDPPCPRVSGSAPTVVLLPGNMCDLRIWRGHNGMLVRVLGENGRQICDADLTRDSSITAMAERVLADSDGLLLPVGFSMGAIVALEMARLAPQRMAGLVLLSLNAGPDLPDRAARRPVQQAEVRNGGLERVLVEELKPNYLTDLNRTNAPLLGLLRDMGMRLGPDVFVQQSEALRLRSDNRTALQAFKGPIFLGCGIEDALCPPEWHERWAAMAQDAELHVVAGAGHMLPLEATARLADLLEAWLMEKL